MNQTASMYFKFEIGGYIMPSENVIEKIKTMYENGSSISEILEATGASRSTIYQHVDCKKYGRYYTKSTRKFTMEDMVIKAYLNKCSPAEIEVSTKFTRKFIDATIKTFEDTKDEIIPDDGHRHTVTRNIYNNIINLYLNGKSIKEIWKMLNISTKTVGTYVKKYCDIFEPTTIRGRHQSTSIEKETESESSTMNNRNMSTTTTNDQSSSRTYTQSPVKECIIIDLGEGQRIEITGDVSHFALIIDKLQTGNLSLKDINDIEKCLNASSITIYKMEEA